MEKITIKNRKGQNIVVLLERNDRPKGLAFIMHGLSGNKEQPHITACANAFKEKNFTVVRFDTTNTFGESDGKYENATVTNYYEDLGDVIDWSKKQEWFIKPYYLVGHSLGGISVILYAEKHPDEIKGLAPIAAVISGKLSLETPKYKTLSISWEKTGWKEEESLTVPGRVKRLPWSHMVDRLRYDVLPMAHTLTMPVLLIVGDKDEGTPFVHQKIFFDKVMGKKEIHVIKGAPHTFVLPHHVEEMKRILLNWIS